MSRLKDPLIVLEIINWKPYTKEVPIGYNWLVQELMAAIEPSIKSSDSSQAPYKTYQVGESKEKRRKKKRNHKIREYNTIILPIIVLSLMISLSLSHFAIPVSIFSNT